MNTRVLVIGDSIVYGAWDTAGGWVDRVKAVMHARAVETQGATKVQVFNMGVGGDSSTRVLARLEHDITTRYKAGWPPVLVLSFGTNDGREKDGQAETSIEEFEQNVRDIIGIAQKYSDKILFVGTVPLGQPSVVFKDHEYFDDRVRSYDEKLREVVAEAGIRYVSLRTVFEAHGLDGLYAYDVVHCNDAGHALIAATVLPVLDELLSE